MLKTHRRKLHCDFLEERALLSGAGGRAAMRAEIRHALVVERHARAELRHLHIDASSVGTMPTGMVTGGGLLAFGTAPTSSETDLFGQVAISDNTVGFLTQLEMLKGTNTTLQQASASVLNDARNLNMLAAQVANSLAIPSPVDIEGPMVSTAQTAAFAANGGSFDKAFLTAMSSVGTAMVSQLQTMEGSNINATMRTFAATALPIVQADMAAIQTVASGGTNPLTPVPSTASSTTLGTSDVSGLASSYSTNLTERFLAQLTALVSGNLQVGLYGAKLVHDHGMAAVQEGDYAASTGTFLPASISTSTDLATAMKVLGAVPNSSGSSTGTYDSNYLQAMVSSHETDISSNENTVHTTTNQALKQFAVNDLPTDLMHLNDAFFILSSMGPTTGTGRTGHASAAHVRRGAHR